MKPDKKLFKRMQKLLAMSKDASSPKEAEIAMRRLYSLLAKYNISQVELENEEDLIITTDFSVQYNRPWIRRLFLSVCRLYFCGVYYQQYGRKAHLYVSGEEFNREYATALCENLVKSIHRLARQESKNLYSKIDNSYVMSFKNGASITICERAIDMRTKAMQGDLNVEDTTLPVLRSVYEKHELAIKDHYADLKLNLETKRSSMSINNYSGYEAGQKYGNTVNLGRGLSNGTKPIKQLTNY